MLQPEQPKQQWQSSRSGQPSRGPRAARGQLGRLLRASPSGSSGCALLLGKTRTKKLNPHRLDQKCLKKKKKDGMDCFGALDLTIDFLFGFY